MVTADLLSENWEWLLRKSDTELTLEMYKYELYRKIIRVAEQHSRLKKPSLQSDRVSNLSLFRNQGKVYCSAIVPVLQWGKKNGLKDLPVKGKSSAKKKKKIQ